MGFGVSDFGFRVSSFRFRVSGVRFRVSDFGFRVSGLGFQVLGFGFQVQLVLGCGVDLPEARRWGKAGIESAHPPEQRY